MGFLYPCILPIHQRKSVVLLSGIFFTNVWYTECVKMTSAQSYIKKKVKKFRLGVKQIIFEVVSGIITAFILRWLTNIGFIPGNISLLVNVILIFGNILLIRTMWSWGLFYTIGWIAGSVVFYLFGLLDLLGIIVYIVLPAATMVTRFVVAIKRSIAG